MLRRINAFTLFAGLAVLGCGSSTPAAVEARQPSAESEARRDESSRAAKQGERGERAAQDFEVFAHDEPMDDPREPDAPRDPLPVVRPSLEGVDGRAIANLSPEDCLRQLRERRVTFERATHDAAPAGVIPAGPVGGVEIQFTGRRRQGSILDCRLVLAIAAWAPALRAIGVRRIRHLSGLRPGAVVATTGRPSGHRHGYAFDPRFFEFDDGTTFDVLEDWEDRTRGAALCETKQEGVRTAAVRGAVCEAIDAAIFQVVVSPHHNDAHQNHLHLEIVPGARWSWAG